MRCCGGHLDPNVVICLAYERGLRPGFDGTPPPQHERLQRAILATGTCSRLYEHNVSVQTRLVFSCGAKTAHDKACCDVSCFRVAHPTTADRRSVVEMAVRREHAEHR